jgi:ABC-type molybdate transport system substrate-binding protein
MLRRKALGLIAAAPAAALVPFPARAGFVDAPDIVVFCDLTLREPLHRLGAMFRSRTGVPVRMICAPGAIMAAQLARNERDDIFISLQPIMRGLAANGLARPQTQVGVWRNRLVVARKGPAATPAKPDAIRALLGGGKLGVTDPNPNAVVDTPALLRRLGLQQALEGRLSGEVDTGGVAWLLAHDQVELGLVMATDARSFGFSTAVAIPDEAYPAIRYETAFSRHVLSRNANAFMQFLGSGEARASLAGSGLEIEA